MREILFRGKSSHGLRKGDWLEGDFVKDFWAPHKDGYGILPKSDDDIGGGYNEVYPETVGQFTGLIDKNGTKIFEGDIVEVSGESDICKITWCGETARFEIVGDGWCSAFDCFYGHDIEVIGNIYDNPELLGEKQ